MRCYRAERQRLKAMQQQTLVLYTRLKAAKKMPPGSLAPSPGTPFRARGDADDADDADDAAVTDSGSSALAVALGRGLGAGSLGARMILTVWRGWARKEAVLARRVEGLQRRWLRGRTKAWLRGWQSQTATNEALVIAAHASVRRYQRRCQRRVFVAWRGLSAGLAAHELALMDSTKLFPPGSPAAGLAAIAAMSRSSAPSGGHGGRRAAAVNAALAAMGGTTSGANATAREGRYDVAHILSLDDDVDVDAEEWDIVVVERGMRGDRVGGGRGEDAE